jgi:DNA repair photolyase
MRWEAQSVTLDDAPPGSVPLGIPDPVVRRFDTPGFAGMTYYEIRAKSIISRVPEASRVPFRWTINPFRGCTHACQWCASGETPILMADGRTKRLAELSVGDRVFGTTRRGRYRRYITTPVLAHWATVKPAYRVTLEDGTELVASGDHRFLTKRGWKHVADNARHPQRAHLTLNDKLIGTGQFATPPEHWPDYRRGYLCGLIRGDGHLVSRLYEAPNGRRYQKNQFRLALTDLQALRRAKAYLADLDVLTAEFDFQVASAVARPLTAIRAQSRDKVATILETVRWPRTPRPEWCKGFLAGIFDAEGGFTGSLRIHNTDSEIIDWTCASLRELGFHFTVEDRRLPNRLRCVRLLGGLREQLRFFHTVDPAIWRKRDIEGIALKSPAPLRVAEIEPLGRGFRLYDITTGTGDFIANGVVSHNCFARTTHEYLDFNAGRDFEREIVVKVNAPEVARAELSKPSWKREHVALGTNTDPYQWVESKYELMPGIWEAMRDTRTPSSVLTKSPLLLRDIELMKQIPDFTANLSIPTIDEKAWRATEPHTPNPYARIEAVAELNRAGIPTGVLIAPLQPGINDQPEQVGRIVELCMEAGAVSIGGIALHLRGSVKALWFEWLEENRPDLIPLYRKLYARGAYAPQSERDRLAALVKTGARLGPPARPDPADRAPEPEPEPEQISLF